MASQFNIALLEHFNVRLQVSSAGFRLSREGGNPDASAGNGLPPARE